MIAWAHIHEDGTFQVSDDGTITLYPTKERAIRAITTKNIIAIPVYYELRSEALEEPEKSQKE